ncbi:hypothetical protein TNCV_1933631 [Trichonephila clavipes]|nr:hypothetical protein TNCV_1933631 [Trichonephila clavipes]
METLEMLSPEGQTLITDYYLCSLRNLRESILREWIEFWQNVDWYRLQHNPIGKKEFLVKAFTDLFPQLPYSPDLSSLTFTCSHH